MGMESAGTPKEQGSGEGVTPITVDANKTFDYGKLADKIAGAGEITVPGSGEPVEAIVPVDDSTVPADSDIDRAVVRMMAEGFFTADNEAANAVFKKYFGRTMDEMYSGAKDTGDAQSTTPTPEQRGEQAPVFIDELGRPFDDPPVGRQNADHYIDPTPPPREPPNVQE